MEHFRRLGFATEIRAQGLPADHPTDIAYFTRYTTHELARPAVTDRCPSRAEHQGHGRLLERGGTPHRVSQKFVEATLRRHAERLAGVEIRYGWTLEAFEDTGDQVNATVRPTAGGESLSVIAQYLVGADGLRSLVRNQLGMPAAPPASSASSWAARCSRCTCAHPRSTTWSSTRAPGCTCRSTLSGVPSWPRSTARPSSHSTPPFTKVKMPRPGRPTTHGAFFRRRWACAIPVEVLSVGTWIAGHSLVAQQFQKGRVFIGGDAAHLFTPTGGLGYNTAVEDAVNLGWKLAAVLRGTSSRALPTAMEIERKPLAERDHRLCPPVCRFGWPVCRPAPAGTGG